MAFRCSSFVVRPNETNQQRKAIGDAVEKSGAAGASQGGPGVAIHANRADVVRRTGVGPGAIFASSGWSTRSAATSGRRRPATDYGVVGMILVVLTLLIVGGRRVVARGVRGE